MKDDTKKNAREYMSDEKVELSDAALEEVAGGTTDFSNPEEWEKIKEWEKQKKSKLKKIFDKDKWEKKSNDNE